jgi:hypothetical protein
MAADAGWEEFRRQMVYLVQKTKIHLSRTREETGRCLEQRIAYHLGRLSALNRAALKNLIPINI